MAKKETSEEKVNISPQMVRNIKAAIFKAPSYDKFLVSVQAQKEDGTVLQYKNCDLVQYTQKFLKPFETSLADSFILDKFKIMASGDGHSYETGYFCPRSFWDWILDYKLA